jgi:hypothetical protein
LAFSERAGKGRERIYAFRTKEEETSHGKEKNTDEEKDTSKEKSADKEEGAGKEAERGKVHWEGRSCSSDQASYSD